jgi:hypothetical protein
MATVARLHDHDPPATLVASLNDWIQSGDVPVSALQQLAQLEAFQPVLREAVLSGTIPVDTPCEVLPQAEALGMDDAWIVDAMLSCTRDARVRFEDRERPARLQELLLQRELTPRQLTYALSLHRSGPEIVRPFLDSEDPEVRSAVLGHLRKAGIPDGEIDRIAAWAAAEAYDGWNGSAMDVLIQHAPERALGILAPRLADADNWNAARMVAKIPSDAAMEALLPVLRRGTERKVEQVAKWVRAHGGPVYEANRGLVDGYLTPTWEKHP